ncbi:MAG: hypothetical protein ACRDR6_02745 [Pseudonocardiaceae bacterium]
MRPAPGLRHQTVGLRLYRVLDDACPDDLYVLAPPFAVQTDVSNEVQPDVLVARFDELIGPRARRQRPVPRGGPGGRR